MRFFVTSLLVKSFRRSAYLPVLFALSLAFFNSAKAAEWRDLAIMGQDGVRHVFRVELAQTPAEHAKGLMFRRELARDAGMLFDFGRSQDVVMWMKNTLLPLDMFFVAEDGRVVNIAERTVPGSLSPIPSDKPVRYVIELNGGTAARLHLSAGDRAVAGLTP